MGLEILHGARLLDGGRNVAFFAVVNSVLVFECSCRLLAAEYTRARDPLTRVCVVCDVFFLALFLGGEVARLVERVVEPKVLCDKESCEGDTTALHDAIEKVCSLSRFPRLL